MLLNRNCNCSQRNNSGWQNNNNSGWQNSNSCCNLNNNVDDCNYEPTGINAQFGYNTMALCDDDNMNNMCCKQRDKMAEEMLKQIRCLKFAITDIGEYLNTHSEDRKALCLHREYCQQLKDLEDKYQRMYGPLTIYFPCNSWRWLEGPWPWEGCED